MSAFAHCNAAGLATGVAALVAIAPVGVSFHLGFGPESHTHYPAPLGQTRPLSGKWSGSYSGTFAARSS